MFNGKMRYDAALTDLVIQGLRHVPDEKDSLRAHCTGLRSLHQARYKLSLYTNRNEEKASQTSWVSMMPQPS